MTGLFLVLFGILPFGSCDVTTAGKPGNLPVVDGTFVTVRPNTRPSDTVNDEALFKKIFSGYNKNVRPSLNWSEPLVVELGLFIRRIEYLDEERQTLLFHGTTRMRWRDHRLAWNPDEFQEVRTIAYASFALWVPEIILSNQADPFGTPTSQQVLATIDNTGQILLAMPSAYKIYCGMDFGKWPYDEQTCVLEFESFTNDGTLVDLQLMNHNEGDAIIVGNFSSSNLWRIMAARAQIQPKLYECCAGPFHSIYFAIIMQRKEYLYGPLMLGPLVAMMFGSWLLFLLPFDSSAKFIFGGLQLVFVGFFSVFLKYTLPPSLEQVPYIVSLTLDTLVLLVLALFAQLTLQNISRLRSRMPCSLRTLLLDGMGRACCLKAKNGYIKSPTIQVSVSEQEVNHLELAHDDTGPFSTTDSEKNHQEWQTLATVLNRVAFALYVAVSLIILI